MAIYSQVLGSGSATDSGVNHLLYTVPPAGGPCIIKSLSAFVAAPGGLILYVNVAGGGPDIYLAEPDNSAGTHGLMYNTVLSQPLPPASTISVQQWTGSAVFWTVILGGYQFDQP